jgi:hypothetical protein
VVPSGINKKQPSSSAVFLTMAKIMKGTIKIQSTSSIVSNKRDGMLKSSSSKLINWIKSTIMSRIDSVPISVESILDNCLAFRILSMIF